MRTVNEFTDEQRAPSEPYEYPEPYDDGDRAYDLSVEEKLISESNLNKQNGWNSNNSN